MEERRKCIVHDYSKQTKGYFIQFAPQVVSDEGHNKFQNTVALVETEDGRVIAAAPEQVQFIEWLQSSLLDSAV